MSPPPKVDKVKSMSDAAYIPALLQIASDSSQLQSAQLVAARRLLVFDGENYPSDGCAITLSVLLQDSGVDVVDTFTAIELGRRLQNARHWQLVPNGQQQAGDVGSTCGAQPNHGSDHIYLVLRAVNIDEMIVADNQASQPHMRFVSGAGGKTPTKYFLRAS